MNGAGLLRCISDETRFSILEMLQREGELCVGDLVERLGRDQPLVSHHLRALRECGIVRSRGEGKRVVYAVSSGRLSALIADVMDASKQIPNLCSDGGRGDGCC